MSLKRKIERMGCRLRGMVEFLYAGIVSISLLVPIYTLLFMTKIMFYQKQSFIFVHEFKSQLGGPSGLDWLIYVQTVNCGSDRQFCWPVLWLAHYRVVWPGLARTTRFSFMWSLVLQQASLANLHRVWAEFQEKEQNHIKSLKAQALNWHTGTSVMFYM